MGRIDILPRDREIVVSLLERFLPEIEVRAFGSRVSRNARRHSDLDLVLMTEIPLDIRTLARLRGAFSESALPFKVDILDWSLLDETFRRLIRDTSVVIRERAPDAPSLPPDTA